MIKRVIAEMGGKDTIIVDKEADLDLAAQNIMASAFGYSGQKCSACSRAVVLEEVYDEVLERVVEKTKQLKIGDVREILPEIYPTPCLPERTGVDRADCGTGDCPDRPDAGLE